MCGHSTWCGGGLTLRKIANWMSKTLHFFQNFFEMSSFWQFCDSQMAIFRRVRSGGGVGLTASCFQHLRKLKKLFRCPLEYTLWEKEAVITKLISLYPRNPFYFILFCFLLSMVLLWFLSDEGSLSETVTLYCPC